LAYEVKILPGALQDIEAIFRWLSIDSPKTASDWYKGLLEALPKLERMPARFPRAPEGEVLGVEIQHLIYKRNYRILLLVEEKIVRIYHVRHSARPWMTKDEFATDG
jgi:plasmid stabilization system protein ParE